MAMKKLTLALSLAAILPVAHQASADPTFMVGIAYNFGGTVGFTAKALSD